MRVFEKTGYCIERQTSSHMILHCPGRPTLAIPDHRELAPNLLRAQIKLAGLTVEEFLRLRR